MYVIEADEPRSKVMMAILTIFGHFLTNFGALIVSLRCGQKTKVGPWDFHRCPVMSIDWYDYQTCNLSLSREVEAKKGNNYTIENP